MTRSQELFGTASICILLILMFGIYWLHILRVSHSSFDEYYSFRGCEQLLERTQSYGVCRTSHGDIIKIVSVNGRWYLDGDLR